MRSGENANQCESNFVLQRRQSQKAKDEDECLTLQEMVDRRIPIEKIRAVVNRGGGVPDEDAPACLKLMRYWINTGKKRSKETELNQTSEMRVTAVGAAALGHMDFDPMQQPLGNAAAPTDLEAILASAQSNSAASANPGRESDRNIM